LEQAPLTFDVLVAGAGLSGLSVAWSLARAGLRVCAADRYGRVGGLVYTRRVPGPGGGRYIVEQGANIIASHPPDALELIRELGLGCQVEERSARDFPRQVFDGERLIEAPLEPFGLTRRALDEFAARHAPGEPNPAAEPPPAG